MFENGQLTVLNINDILPNRFQPRIRFDEEKLEELAESIGKYGVIQPIVVRPVGNKYEIIAGERRYKASKLANKSTIPAIIVNLSDKDSEEIALLENIQRQQLSPIEEAVSYKRILDMGYITQEQLAKKLGKSQSTIANKIRLLNLDDEVQSYLLNNKISERHARSLLRIPDKEKQVEMLHRIVEERLTVKQTDKEIEKLKEETKIDNRPVEPVVMEKPNVNKTQAVTEVQPSNLSEEVESLFDEPDNAPQVKEGREGNTMDIEKIMREAKDINVPQQQAPRDISGLMQPGNDVQSEPIVREEPTTAPVNLENSRFINVAPQQEVPQTVQQPSNNGVTFDSMFNQHIDVESSVTPQSAIPVQPEAHKDVQSEHPGHQVQPKPSEVLPASATFVQNNGTSNSMNTSDQPIMQTNQNVSDVNTLASDEVSEDTKKNISHAVADALKRFNEQKLNTNVNKFQVTQPQSSIVQPSVPDVNKTSTSEMVNSTSSHLLNQNVQRPVIQSTSDIKSTAHPSIPSVDIIADDTLNEYAIHPNQPAISQSTMASTMTQNVKPVNNQAHFAQIVKLLRDCANQIENNGYFVSVDEMDLGNQYKVTFTIDKE